MAGQSSEVLAHLIETLPGYAICLLSMDGVIQSWNAGAEEVTGYTADEAIGMPFARLYSEDDIRAGRPTEDLQGARTGRSENERWLLRKDGSRFWASTLITPFNDPTGRTVGFAQVTRDLTQRRAAEEELRRSEEMFRLLVASVQDYAIFMLDPGGHIASWNIGAERIKQYRFDEIVGKHFSTFYPPEDVAAGKPERELREAIRDGRIEDEGWRVRKDGSRFWANVVITAVFDELGELRGFAKVTRDVTARKQAEETQRALLEQSEARLRAEEEKRRAEASYRSAQEANRAKDEFLMTLSHELRTPMTAILGWARLLPTLPPDEPTAKEAIAAIARSAQLQAKLIDDVLDVSRIVSGKLRLTIETVEVANVLDGALEAVRPSAAAKQISIRTDFNEELGTATLDPTRLQQVVWNLLTNAVKFTPRGGRVELSAERGPSDLKIIVKDNGEGIDPDFLPHIFEPFRQAETPVTRVHGGLGLGLSIVRYLVEAHGGNISAESEGRGKGSKFVVSLPVRAIRAVPAPVAKTEEETHFEQLANLHGQHIVVVDDDGAGRELIAASLRQAGAKVTAFGSANDALKFVEQNTPNIIITDIAMPEMDGYALQRHLRQKPQLAAVPIVALTAFPPSAMSVNEREFDMYLRKPIDPFELTERISELVKPA